MFSETEVVIYSLPSRELIQIFQMSWVMELHSLPTMSVARAMKSSLATFYRMNY